MERALLCAAWAMALLPLIRPECQYNDEWPGGMVRCISSSINDYSYDVLPVHINSYQTLDISRSHFPKVERLILPKDIRVLKITSSNVSSVASDLLNDYYAIQVLDFSRNQLATFSLNKSCCNMLRTLNLSHNKIRVFDWTWLPLSVELNLGFNELEELDSEDFTHVQFTTLNLEHNPLKTLRACAQVHSIHYNRPYIQRLILSGLNLTSLFLNTFFSCFQIAGLNIRDAALASDASLDYWPDVLWPRLIKSISWPPSTLRELNVSSNSLRLRNNSFVEWWQLEVLSLANCSLEVVHVDTFRGLEKTLLSLNLSSNLLRSVDAHPFRDLKQLRQLDLSRNLIDGLGVEAFANLPHLETLDLSGNRICVIETGAFANLPRLLNVRIARNDASLSLHRDAFRENATCQHLDLSDSPVDLSSSLLAPCRYRQLTLSASGKGWERAFKVCDLNKLTVTNAVLDTLSDYTFHTLRLLSSLSFDRCAVGHVAPCAFCGLFGLESFDAKCIFAGKRLAAGTFRHLHRLRALDLSGVELLGVQPRAFFRLRHVLFLDLSRNNLTQLAADSFDGLDGLQILNLTDNHIQALELGTFQRLPRLYVLLLSGNALQEFKVGVFSNLPQLWDLRVARNNISTVLIESLLPLRKLQVLDLEYNNLKQLDYQYLGNKNFPLLRTIGIANNRFPCDYLKDVMVALGDAIRRPSRPDYYDDNIDGVDCVDVCKYVLCLKDSHGIN